MSPRFYSYLWAIFGISAASIWIGGAFTLLVGVVYGFIAFGLIFAGMMCVLPGVVSHGGIKKLPTPRMELDPSMRPVALHRESAHLRLGLRLR